MRHGRLRARAGNNNDVDDKRSSGFTSNNNTKNRNNGGDNDNDFNRDNDGNSHRPHNSASSRQALHRADDQAQRTGQSRGRGGHSRQGPRNRHNHGQLPL